MDNGKDLIIGIDPDLDKNGVAITYKQTIISLHGLNYVQLQKLIDAHPEAGFIVEDVEYNKPVFNRRLKPLENLKVAQNVGMVKGVARLIIQYLTETNSRFIKVPPLNGRFKQAKKDRDYFNRLTGWQGSSNADKRDAALIALYGRRNPNQLILRPSEVAY